MIQKGFKYLHAVLIWHMAYGIWHMAYGIWHMTESREHMHMAYDDIISESMHYKQLTTFRKLADYSGIREIYQF
jgi:hypothetical protein